MGSGSFAAFGYLRSYERGAVAANSICSVIYQVTLSFVIGVSSASAVIIGKTVGQGDLSQTSQYAHKLLRVYFVVGLALAGLILLLREPMVQFYKIAPETAAMAQQFMLVYAVVMFCTGFCHPLITGILRGGGDIMYAAVTDVGLCGCFCPLVQLRRSCAIGTARWYILSCGWKLC